MTAVVLVVLAMTIVLEKYYALGTAESTLFIRFTFYSLG